MKRASWSWACFVLLSMFSAERQARAADPPPPAEAQARRDLAGVWRGFAVEGKGEKPDQGPVKLEITISAETIKGVEFKGGQSIDHGEGVYALDLDADPRQLDGTKSNTRGRKETWLGIYKLEQDTLYWCAGRRERPTSFETVKGQFLMILKRATP